MQITEFALAIVAIVVIYYIAKLLFFTPADQPPIAPPPPPPVDCTKFENRNRCSCLEHKNKNNPWCKTADELYDNKNCDGKCQERTGASRCALHFRSSPNQFLYYCARLK
jgi:hypothetical protein